MPVGVGGHSLLVPMACEKAKIPCDFYVKTFHSDDYPSAIPKPDRKEWFQSKGYYDNMWCINPEETAEFMAKVTKPWIAFKVLAAGNPAPAGIRLRLPQRRRFHRRRHVRFPGQGRLRRGKARRRLGQQPQAALASVEGQPRITSRFIAFRSAKVAAFAERKATIVDRPTLSKRSLPP